MKQVQTKNDIYKLINENNEKLNNLGVENLGIFGSFASGKQSNESDVDILVNFKDGQKNFKNFMGLAYLLEDLLGRKVELITNEGMSPHIKPYILEKIEYVKVA